MTDLTLAGKNAIVTGASRGIGAGIAFELAKRGANVSTHTNPQAKSRGIVITDDLICDPR